MKPNQSTFYYTVKRKLSQPHCPSQEHLNVLPPKSNSQADTTENFMRFPFPRETSFASVFPDSTNTVFNLYVCQKCNLTVLPITTKLSSCFPPCLFSNSAFTSICGFVLLDFFTGVGTVFCSSETCTTWGERVDCETASSTPEATLASSVNSPFWGVLAWPFSSAITLGEKRKHKECKWQRSCRNIGEKLSFPFAIT